MFKWVEKLLQGRNVCYYPGCITRYAAPELEKNYEKILNLIGIDFIKFNDFVCCGSPVRNAGYEDDFKDLIKKNTDFFKKYSVRKIITNCPGCHKTFGMEYPETDSSFKVESEHITITIWDAIQKGKLALKTVKDEPIAYHDPCHLGRYAGIYDEPRQILEYMGYKVIEMDNNKETALCCGAGAGLRNNEPKIAGSIGKMVMKNAEALGVKKLVTTCTLCAMHLRENSNIEVLELSEVIINATS